MKKLILTSLFICLFFPQFASAAVNLHVPFTVQAPEGDWRQPWQDACEEAVIAMVDAYYAGKSLDIPSAKAMIQRIVRLETNLLGYHRDTGSADMINIINRYFPWEARVMVSPSLAKIKTEIDNSRPVIMLVYGRALRNPYFHGGGPDYHTIVISGYDDDKKEFITQEPGTRRGLDFRYSYDRIMAAMHDYVPGYRTRTGTPVAIFTQKRLDTSAESDGDNDGLSKLMELRYGTVLWLTDSDGDGFSDGLEVKYGFPPTRKTGG